MSKNFKKPYTSKQKQKRGDLSNRLKQLLLEKAALELKFDNVNNKLLFEIDKLKKQINEKKRKENSN